MNDASGADVRRTDGGSSPDAEPCPQRQGPNGVTVRCPYCRQEFDQPPVTSCVNWTSRCPHCGMTALLPVGVRPPIVYKAPPEPRERYFLPKRRTGSHEQFALWYARALRHPRTVVMIVVVTTMVMLVWLSSRYQEPVTGVAPRSAKEAEVVENLRALRTALELFRNDCGRYPTSQETLTALVHNTGAKGWKGPYIDALKPDPWYHPYVYAVTADVVRLASNGPDGVPGGGDDISAPAPDFRLLTIPVTPEPP